MRDKMQSWLLDNVLRIVTAIVVAIALVAVANYKLDSLEKSNESLVEFRTEQRRINMETDHKINKLVSLAEMQQVADERAEENQQKFNERLEKLIDGLQDSVRSTEKLTAALDERTKFITK